jgi:transcriptional regulator of heat shock response
MEERTNNILEAVVREFIETGEPVSSGWLFDHYEFGIRPAMIRAELNDLTERGFLEQAHHSGGRVPANRAYEFFAEHVLSENINKESTVMRAPFARLMQRGLWNELATELSDELGMLGVVGTYPPGVVYKEGLHELIDRLDWDSRSEVKSVIRDFEDFDERMEQAIRLLNDDEDVKVFVGKKSPVTKSEQLSVMVRGCESDGTKVFFFAVGPKRMDYEKTANFLRGLRIND